MASARSARLSILPATPSMDSPTGISIIVPAHNEEAVLGHCLESVAAQDVGGPVQVVVAVNGCSDRTLAVAHASTPLLERRGFDYDVIDLTAASKAEALNAGDRAARFGHRVYLDADVTLSANALSSVMSAFRADPGLKFCSPRLKALATTYTGGVYARVWAELPYVKDEVIGAGCYIVRDGARSRWTTFPDIVADDKFARLHFDRAERRVVEDAEFRVHLPVGVAELVRVRSRWIRANRELRALFPELARTDKRRYGGSLRFIARNPALWIDLVPFSAIYLAAEIRAVTSRHRGPRTWERAARARESRVSA
jgi:glycosyltransferase involved in cell wall biosynthesis